MSKKKTLKGVFHGLSELSNNMFFDVDNLSDNEKDANITGINVESLLDLAVNTFKTKCVNTSAVFGSSLSSFNFDINDNEEWFDPKIVKIQIKVSVKKLFALDINFSAVKRKLIIRSTFISEKNMEKTISLARKKEITINNNLKKQKIHSDWAVIHCTVIGFESENELESTFCTEPIFSVLECDAFDILVSAPSKKSFKRNTSDVSGLQLTRLYAKKNVSIFCSAAFDGNGNSLFVLINNSFLSACLASLEHFLELLSDQVSGIVCKISGMKLVPLALPPFSGHSVVLINIDLDLNSDMVLNSFVVVPTPPFVVLALGLSSLKILTTKMGCLESKLVALEVSIGSVLVKLDQLCVGSSFRMFFSSQ
ncbi:hypothetical protein G9A89_007789 [Geosiphon pyriformis]|nr:hypothetical protein G9A89_007789 [Geosiphon pyriformis]